MTPLEYMRRVGAFEIEKDVYRKYLGEVSIPSGKRMPETCERRRTTSGVPTASPNSWVPWCVNSFPGKIDPPIKDARRSHRHLHLQQWQRDSARRGALWC